MKCKYCVLKEYEVDCSCEFHVPYCTVADSVKAALHGDMSAYCWRVDFANAEVCIETWLNRDCPRNAKRLAKLKEQMEA